MRQSAQHPWPRSASTAMRIWALAAALVPAAEPGGAAMAQPLPSSATAWSLYPSEPWSPYASEPWPATPATPRRAYPSEAWSPYPSEAWSPRVAQTPTETAELPEPPELKTPAFAPPAPTAAPLEFVGPPPIAQGRYASPGAPFEAVHSPVSPPEEVLPYGYAPNPNHRPHSHFLPGLGRFGVVAPRTPGLDSVHSPYVIGPVPWGAAASGPTLFPPPPGGAAAAHDATPCIDPLAEIAPYSSADFSPDPSYDHLPYEPCPELGVYGGKHLNPTQRPLIEFGMPFYSNGPVPPPSFTFGVTNPSVPRFYLYGDYRAAGAYNDAGAKDKSVIAHRLNLEWDFWLTATERFHMSTGPFQEGNDFMRFEFDDGRGRFVNELDFFDEQTDALFFEGDVGYMLGGVRGTYAAFDLPVAAGLMPLLFQNGVWMEDTILGIAAAIPARNSPWLDWSNFDVTFFAGFDQVTSPAFNNDNSAASVFGTTTFIEAKGGYLEAGYAFLDDTQQSERSYHNLGFSYTRRYLNLVSNSLRVIANAGQGGPRSTRTADGVLLLAENSFLTPWPYNVIPYLNLFAGFDSPQSVARAGAAGGVLRNTGILFESDNLTGYPTLDATARDSYGAALGLDLLAPDFSQQLILEAAVVQQMGNAGAGAPEDQYGLGLRYQIPITNAHLLRFDAMHGWLDGGDNISGARAEYRWKF